MALLGGGVRVRDSSVVGDQGGAVYAWLDRTAMDPYACGGFWLHIAASVSGTTGGEEASTESAAMPCGDITMVGGRSCRARIQSTSSSVRSSTLTEREGIINVRSGDSIIFYGVFPFTVFGGSDAVIFRAVSKEGGAWCAGFVTGLCGVSPDALYMGADLRSRTGRVLAGASGATCLALKSVVLTLSIRRHSTGTAVSRMSSATSHRSLRSSSLSNKPTSSV